MGWSKRVRANWVWGLFFAIIGNEWHQPRKMGFMLLSAALTAIGFSLFDAANERWTWATLSRWLKRRKRDSGAA